MRFFVLLLIGVWVAPSVSLAETIYLKNGKVVKGKVLERTSYHIVVDENGFPRRYYLDQVDRTEEDGVVPAVKAPAVEGVSQEKADLIVQFMEVSGTRTTLEKDFEGIVARVPIKDQKKIRESLKMEVMIDKFILIYDKYYTVEDLKVLIGFYASPVGQKVVEVTPGIMQDTVQVTIEHLQGKVTP